MITLDDAFKQKYGIAKQIGCKKGGQKTVHILQMNDGSKIALKSFTRGFSVWSGPRTLDTFL